MGSAILCNKCCDKDERERSLVDESNALQIFGEDFQSLSLPPIIPHRSSRDLNQSLSPTPLHSKADTPTSRTPKTPRTPRTPKVDEADIEDDDDDGDSCELEAVEK
ncbi:SLC34A1, partial [Symbiodinium pilosum]